MVRTAQHQIGADVDRPQRLPRARLVRELVEQAVEREGVPPVQLPALPGHELPGDHLADEAVAQRVALGRGVDDDERGGPRLPQRGHQGRLGEPHDLGEQPVRDRLLPQRHRLHDGGGRGAEGRDPPEHQVAQRPGEGSVLAGADGAQGLGDDERVAAGALPHAVDQVRVVPRGRRDEAPDGRAVQRAEVAHDRPRVAAELGHHHLQRVPGRERLGTQREHDEDRFAAQVRGEGHDDVAGPAVRPVQVLDGDQDRGRLGERGQHPTEQLQALRPRIEGLAGRRVQEGGELRGVRGEHGAGVGGGPIRWRSGEQAPQPRDQRPERQLLPDVDRRPGEDERPVGLGVLDDAAQQPALARPGLPAQQHRRRVPRPDTAPRSEQRVEFGTTPRFSVRRVLTGHEQDARAVPTPRPGVREPSEGL